jgi:porphobilinogen deaminase
MSNKDKILKIGTRGSPLAMVQATTVQRLLAEHWPALETEIVVIRTSGDWLPAHGEVRLSEVEGGGYCCAFDEGYGFAFAARVGD